MKKKSGPIILIETVWNHANEGKGHSWKILNGALYDALKIAITSGFTFREDDFSEMEKRFNVGYWMGNSYGRTGEGFYSMAAGANTNSPCVNRSACMAFEKWVDRKPFILNGERLAIGREVTINDRRWFVTSFSSDNSSIGLSSYYREDNKFGHKDGVPTRRTRINPTDLKALKQGTFTV